MEINRMGQGRQNMMDYNLNNNGKTDGAQKDDLKNSYTDSSKCKVKEDDAKKAVDKLNKLFEDKSTHAEYEVYGKFKDITIKIVDNKTKEVIREMPPKKIIDMIDKLCELAGVFMDKKA